MLKIAIFFPLLALEMDKTRAFRLQGFKVNIELR